MIDNIRWVLWNNQKVRWWYKQNMFLFTKNAEKDEWDGNVVVHPQLFEKRVKELRKLKLDMENSNGLFMLHRFFIRLKNLVNKNLR